ncbi:MAG: nickel pincer cofactor biosynthesis protein LarC [Candidatus Nealsonbacteria bacterium]|nr:nickel pincer cofactor biosynthesis protein LarC [Candidatus Nealsonbacteria bacterium]
MRILYLNCRSGASGDMIAAALLDLWADKSRFFNELDKLGLKNYRVEIKKIDKKGVRALRFIVHTQKEDKERGIGDIYRIIGRSSLSKEVKQLSKKIFFNLAKAEAKAHKTSIGKVHFHEVGAVDSIIDIIAAAILVNKLKPQKIYASVSAGTLIFPAAKELLKEIPLTVIKINKELVTPTGAAILKTIVDEFADDINIKVVKKGHGSGKINLKIPNVLEVIMGETKMEEDKSIILETNIDDMNPQFYAFVIDRLIKAGAREAFIQPIVMKKNRLGTLLTAICDEKIKDKLIEIIFNETTTFGVRVNKISRICLDREFKKIETKYGLINVKIGKYKGKVRTISPEYEDCKGIAIKRKLPVKTVYNEAKRISH